MSAPSRVAVILEQGRVVGVQLLPATPAGAGEGPAASAALGAGPQQTRHEVLARVPRQMRSEATRKRFHAELLAQIAAKR